MNIFDNILLTYEKLKSRTIPPQENIKFILFPVADWRNRFPPFKETITRGQTAPFDDYYQEPHVFGVPVKISSDIPADEVWFIMGDKTVSILKLKDIGQ